MITDDQINQLRDVFIQYGVTLAYLFGSQAEGTARPKSDVDIAVLLPHERFKEPTTDEELRLFVAIYAALGRDDVDVVILNEAPPLLAFEVVKYGKILYEDPRDRPAVDFAAYTFSRYADTKHFRKVALRYFVERVEQRRSQRAGLALREGGP